MKAHKYSKLKSILKDGSCSSPCLQGKDFSRQKESISKAPSLIIFLLYPPKVHISVSEVSCLSLIFLIVIELNSFSIIVIHLTGVEEGRGAVHIRRKGRIQSLHPRKVVAHG